MASINKYINTLLSAEGGYVDHKNDRGGATNRGITLRTWERYGHDKNGDGIISKEDIKLITEQDAIDIYKLQYWDTLRADEIRSQSVANILFDFGVNSGVSRAIKSVQWILNTRHRKDIAVDGIIGPQTIGAINSVSGAALTRDIKDMRKSFYHFLANDLDNVKTMYIDFFEEDLRVAPNDSQKVFLRGWLNRLDHFNIAVSVGALVTAVGFFLAYRYLKRK